MMLITTDRSICDDAGVAHAIRWHAQKSAYFGDIVRRWVVCSKQKLEAADMTQTRSVVDQPVTCVVCLADDGRWVFDPDDLP